MSDFVVVKIPDEEGGGFSVSVSNDLCLFFFQKKALAIIVVLVLICLGLFFGFLFIWDQRGSSEKQGEWWLRVIRVEHPQHLSSSSSSSSSSPFHAHQHPSLMEDLNEIVVHIYPRSNETGKHQYIQDRSQRKKAYRVEDGNYSFCENTRQGSKYITDNQGYICKREHIDEKKPGCCKMEQATRRFSCRFCRANIQCCVTYEECVTCCISPPYIPLLQQKTLHLNSTNFSTSLIQVEERFKVCSAFCRTSSSSIEGKIYKDTKTKLIYVGNSL